MGIDTKAVPPSPGTNQRSPGSRAAATTKPPDETRVADEAHAANGWQTAPKKPRKRPEVVAVPKATGTPSPEVMMIRHLALEISRKELTVPKESNFYQRLAGHYLKDLLESDAAKGSDERKALGKGAIARIGAAYEGVPPAGDYWAEGAAKEWKKRTVPKVAQKLLPGLPEEIEGATDILSPENREKLLFPDIPQLLGDGNSSVGADADVLHGGKNISHLLHWATGVKYSHVAPEKLKALFLIYELWHLEGWDVFGEDPINDLISEEQGRLLGRLLLDGEIDRTNFHEKLDETFVDARVWVGRLLAQRQAELDGFLNAETQPPSNMWWGKLPEMTVWNEPTLREQLGEGKTLDEVRQSRFAQRAAAIYALIYESQSRGRLFGGLSPMEKDLAAGELNETIRKVVLKKEELSSKDYWKVIKAERPSLPLP